VSCVFTLVANKYYDAAPESYPGEAGAKHTVAWLLRNGPWYDFSVMVQGQKHYSRRFAGRMETGKASFCDPAMEGVAVVEQYRLTATQKTFAMP
jgi:phospholipase C